MSNYNYVCNFNLDDCIKTLGLDEGGKVQQFITKEFEKNVQPYVPFDLAGKYNQSGRLKDSGHTDDSESEHKHMAETSSIENKTDIVWNTPYARRLYYHPEYNFQGAPMRGAYWADRYMQNGGKEQLEQGARKVVKK